VSSPLAPNPGNATEFIITNPAYALNSIYTVSRKSSHL